jgi:hypothetical protein
VAVSEEPGSAAVDEAQEPAMVGGEAQDLAALRESQEPAAGSGGPDSTAETGAPDPVARFEGTGEPERLEEALTALDELPLEEHGPAYERLHAELRRLLDREPSEVPEGLLRGIREPADPEASPGPEASPAPEAGRP